jgi:predicted TIM-barrel fold metal-dependent hydrolase
MLAAEVDQYQVVDTDTHVIEPYDLWTSRMSVAKWGDQVPHVKMDDDLGEEAWYFGDNRVGGGAGAAHAGYSKFAPEHPKNLGEADRSTWDVNARLARMDEYGIWAEVLYPNVAGFGAGRLLTMGDPDLMLACIQAYNDFLSDYASTDRSRFIPIMALPMWDVPLCETEMDRSVALGHKGVIMTGEPEFWGLPKLQDPHWDPMWAAAQERGLSINFHIGSGDMSIFNAAYPPAGKHANYAGFGVQFGMSNIRVISNLITGGVCHRFPSLKFVSVESGVGWMPFALNHLDWQWKNCGVPFEHPEYDLLPTEYFVRQMYGCFWFETDTVKAAVDILGPDWILYETDFPHPTSMSPGPGSAAVVPRDFIADGLSDLPQDVLQKILHNNAAKLYHME